MSWGAVALQLLPSILGSLGQVASSYISTKGSNSSAMNQQTNQQSIGSTDTTGASQTSSSTTGSQTTTGSVSGISDLLSKAMTGITGNNSSEAATFNAGQAQTANNLQSGQWALANVLNLWSTARANELNAQAQTSAMAYNREEAQKNRDWQEQMSNTSYQRGVADLKAAGLNPILAAYNGFGASAGSGGQGSVGNQTFQHAQASAIPSAHTATMQSMYDYGNNTAQFLQNAMQTINSAKETKNWNEASTMESIMHNIANTSAQTVGQIAQSASSDYTSGNEQSSSTIPKAISDTDKLINNIKNKIQHGNGGKTDGSGAGRKS